MKRRCWLPSTRWKHEANHGHRSKIQSIIQEKHGLGLRLYVILFTKAVCVALQEWRIVRLLKKWWEWDVFNDYLWIFRFAAQLRKGLVVPVFEMAEAMSLTKSKKSSKDLRKKRETINWSIWRNDLEYLHHSQWCVFDLWCLTPNYQCTQSANLGWH